MKISTKTGDKGETGLFGGKRVGKDFPLIELLGDLDELHSFLGLAKFGAEVGEDLMKMIERVQDDIYRIQALVGFEMKMPSHLEDIGEKDVQFLESEMEKRKDVAEGLNKFIRPGSTETAARLHVVRSVCRRVERTFWGVCRELNLEVPEWSLKYLNRLSDLLFVAGLEFEAEV